MEAQEYIFFLCIPIKHCETQHRGFETRALSEPFIGYDTITIPLFTFWYFTYKGEGSVGGNDVHINGVIFFL